MAASHVPPTGDLAHNPGMFPDWESNQQPFGSQASTQPTEPHQPEPIILFLKAVQSIFQAKSYVELQPT